MIMTRFLKMLVPSYSGGPESSSLPASPAPDLARYRRWQQMARSLMWFLLLGTAMIVIMHHYVVGSVKVVGSSMSPTLKDSQTYLLNRAVYFLRAPRPGDVVVLRDPLDGMLSVKRVVAKPGDSVGFLDGKVFVNGAELKEPYLEARKRTHSETEAKIRTSTTLQFRACGKDEYFVLGDNRNHSVDSRDFGPIKRSAILGMVLR